MKRTLIILLCAIVSACAAAGVQVTEQQLSFLVPGKTTIAETVSILGQPNMNTRNPDGSRTISYVYSEAQTRPETFVPIVGAFIGGMDIRSNVVMIQFDQEGHLITHTSSVHAIGSGTNFSSGATSDRVPNQPKQSPK